MPTTTVSDIRFADARSLGDRLSEQLDQLREAAPVYWSKNQNAWIITGHKQVTAAFRDSKAFSSAGREKRMLGFLPEEERATRAPYLVASLRRMVFSMDGPDHARYRRLIMAAFERPVLEPYTDDINAIIGKTFDEVPLDRPFDYVSEVAYRVPSNVILRLLGLPEHFLTKMRGWARAVVLAVGGGGTTPEMIDAAEAALIEMRDALWPEVERRRANPGHDFISTLIKAEDNGIFLSDEEVLANCYLVLLAGHDSTSNTMGLGSVCLARDPELWQFFATVEDDEALLSAVLEINRIIGMSYATARIVARDATFDGHDLRKGDLVYLMQGIANRDPGPFADPKTVAVDRSQRGNLSFGAGVHMCLGHLLAKMELTAFFQQLTRRFAGMELLDTQLHWATNIGNRGLHDLTVRLIPRA